VRGVGTARRVLRDEEGHVVWVWKGWCRDGMAYRGGCTLCGMLGQRKGRSGLGEAVGLCVGLVLRKGWRGGRSVRRNGRVDGGGF